VKRTFYPNDVATGKLKTIDAKRGGTSLYSRVIGWNRLDLVTAMTDPNAPGSGSTYGYDAKNMGFLTSAKGARPDQTFTYDSIGNRKTRDGASYTYVSGTDKLETFGPSTNAQWNANGTLKSLTNGNDTFTFTYDARGQLVKATSGASSGFYAYDFAGNALVQQPPGQNYTLYNIASDYEIADYGNNKVVNTKYIEGLFGRTVAITTNATTVQSAAVIRNNRALEERLFGTSRGFIGSVERGANRVALLMTGPSLRERFFTFWLVALWAAALAGGAVLKRAGATDWRRRRPLFAPVVPVVLIAFLFIAVPAQAGLTPGGNGAGNPTAGTLYFVQDLVGSTVSVTDDSGASTAAVAYEAFGGVDQSGSTGTDNFRPKFSGKPFDHGVAQYDFGARYYDPATGRFSTPDPEAQWVNPYVYAANSPVSLVDPTGEFAFLVAIVIGALVGAYMGAAAVNHDYNPAHWDWKSGKTYAGLFGGAIIGAVGGAIVEVAATAGVAAGIAGAMLVGAGENAAFTAMGGGSMKEILISAAEGAAFGFVFGAAGAGVSRLLARFGRRGASALAEAAEGVENQAARGLRESCASFVGGQQVLTADGTLKPIESLRVGDRVAGQETERERNGTFRVDATLFGYTEEVTRVVTRTGNVIETTPAHLFRTAGMGWIRADELNPDIRLASADGKPVAVASVETRRERRAVYNVSVDTAENYFVSPDRVLVKNVRGACLVAKGIKRPGWRKPSKEAAWGRQTIKSGKYKGYVKSAVSNERYLRSAKVKIGKNNPRFISRWQLDHRIPYKYLLWAADQTSTTIKWTDMIRISNFADNLRWITMAENVSHRFEPLVAAGRKGAIAIFKALGYWS
ncbi:MAG TPA: RHS repeat-associated core domain-containing protein, partial [Thermoanaerobaculia bacterium]|nr:RHS repeat-associated core domain-containing protein [Thermoanaerobaculia bacterium]